MAQSGLDDRHRDKDGKISLKHGNTLIGTLRQTYGTNFARGEPDTVNLGDVLHRLDEPSLRQLIKNVHGGATKAAPAWIAGDEPITAGSQCIGVSLPPPDGMAPVAAGSWYLMRCADVGALGAVSVAPVEGL